MIVDDEPSVLDALALLLTDEGYPVQTAPDCHAALDLIAADLPDLLITDVMMPRLDGWSLLASVRECLPTLPVIVISALDLKAGSRDVLGIDHTIFLRKPFDIEALLTTVDRLIGSPPH